MEIIEPDHKDSINWIIVAIVFLYAINNITINNIKLFSLINIKILIFIFKNFKKL